MLRAFFSRLGKKTATVCLLPVLAVMTLSAGTFQDTIRVGIYQNKPKIFIDQDGQASGIFADILGEIAKDEDWELVYVPNTWEGCLRDLQDGRTDLMPDVAISIERTEFLKFNKIPVLHSWSQIYSDRKHRIVQLSDLANKRIAVLDQGVQQANLRELLAGLGYPYTEISVVTMDQAFTQVKIGIADVAIVNHYFGSAFHRDFDLIPSPLILQPTTLHFAVDINADTRHLDTIDSLLNQWKQTPHSVYYQLLKQYLVLKEPDPRPDSKRWWLLISAGSVLLALIAFILLRKQKKQHADRLLQTGIQLKEEEEKFKTYIEKAPFGIFVTDRNGYYLEANQQSGILTGYTQQELIGLHVKDLIPQSFAEKAALHFEQVVSEGYAVGTLPYLTKQGEQRYWTISAVKLTDDRMLGFVFDVTEQQRVRNELEELKNKLEIQVEEKTSELQARIKDLEHFHDVTIEREIRMKELLEENQQLKSKYL